MNEEPYFSLVDRLYIEGIIDTDKRANLKNALKGRDRIKSVAIKIINKKLRDTSAVCGDRGNILGA